ncbi:hypothetical protein [Corynebacterium flavescens]|uniref:hypothetical protein n=1 Tax=Corynebacterium flavescens TaxID=28028 RepID=UPI002647D7E3|nr:hypothetical protein [Corynebacterium flavescens]MDN6199385.1 hypothetical protein [Corynebacterium flavescens]
MPIEHLPKRVRPLARRVRDWAMTDATALIVLGGGAVARGLSYAPHQIFGPAPEKGTHPAEGALDISAWAVVWIVVGVACIVSAFWKNTALASASIGAGIGLNVLWAMSFATATITGDMPRGWVSSIGYLSIAVLVLWAVWRGKRNDFTIPEGAVTNELRRDTH